MSQTAWYIIVFLICTVWLFHIERKNSIIKLKDEEINTLKNHNNSLDQQLRMQRELADSEIERLKGLIPVVDDSIDSEFCHDMIFNYENDEKVIKNGKSIKTKKLIEDFSQILYDIDEYLFSKIPHNLFSIEPIAFCAWEIRARMASLCDDGLLYGNRVNFTREDFLIDDITKAALKNFSNDSTGIFANRIKIYDEVFRLKYRRGCSFEESLSYTIQAFYWYAGNAKNKQGEYLIEHELPLNNDEKIKMSKLTPSEKSTLKTVFEGAMKNSSEDIRLLIDEVNKKLSYMSMYR